MTLRNPTAARAFRSLATPSDRRLPTVYYQDYLAEAVRTALCTNPPTPVLGTIFG